LRLHKELAAEQPLEIVSTFLGAHVVSGGVSGKKTGGAERYIQLIEQNLLAGDRREEAGGVFAMCFAIAGAFFDRAIENAFLQAGPPMGTGSPATCRAAFADGRGAAGNPDAGGKLRSSGTSKQERRPGAGKIGNRGDAAAGMRFSPGAEKNMRRRGR